MNLWKRFARIAMVLGAAGLIYAGANTPEPQETSMPLEDSGASAGQSENTQVDTENPETETSSDSLTDAENSKETEESSETDADTEQQTNAAEESEMEMESGLADDVQGKLDSEDSSEHISENESSSEDESSSENENNSGVETSSEGENTSGNETSSEGESSSDNEASSEGENTSGNETSSEGESELTTEAASTEEPSSEALSPTETETESATESIIGDNYEISVPADSKALSPKFWMVPSYELLREELNSMLETYEGRWSIYLKDLKADASLTINDQPQDSASLIKLYIAGTVLEEIHNGNLEETETIDQLLSDMISLSDNEASNELVRYLSKDHNHEEGLLKVNQFIENHDFTDTHQFNGLEDPSLWYNSESPNITSVTDCGRFLEEVYEGDLISHLDSRRIEGYLLNQDITWKIPAGIPSEIKTANKTGEKDNTQNDVSLVYSPYGDYILCVMGTDLTDEDSAVEHIRDISRTVYGFFTEGSFLSQEAETETESEVTE